MGGKREFRNGRFDRAAVDFDAPHTRAASRTDPPGTTITVGMSPDVGTSHRVSHHVMLIREPNGGAEAVTSSLSIQRDGAPSLVSFLHLIEEQAADAALLQALHAPVFYLRDCAYPGRIYSCFSREAVYGEGTEW